MKKKEIENKTNLSTIEKETFIANLRLISYKTQRAKNKIFYFHCIGDYYRNNFKIQNQN